MSDGVPLREYFEALLRERDKRYEQRFEAQTKAITKAEAATEKRFEGVNEFRQTLSDQAATFITRVEFDALEKRVGDLAEQGHAATGHGAGLRAAWGYLLGAAGLIATTVTLIATR